MEPEVFYSLAIALGLGLLVGFEREWARKPVAGIRTFPLITMFGVLAATLGAHYGGWVVAAGLIAVAAMVVMGNVARYKEGEYDVGVTSEMAALMMYMIGAALGAGYTLPAIAAAGVVAVLLNWKAQLHRFVGKTGREELSAVIRFVLIAMVILPLLPNEEYGPYGVLNPFKIWLMVVLIVGISLGAYLAYVLLGARGGTLLAGVLGGLISSTATTVSYARWTRQTPAKAQTAAVVVTLASAIVFGRVLFEIGVVAPSILWETAAPLLVVMAWITTVALVAFFVWRRGLTAPATRGEPPSNLIAAIVFGLLYGAVLVGVAFAKEHFGDRGLYVVAAVSGLTDMDAITLSSAQMIQSGSIEAATGWRMILIGAMANLFFKACVVVALGNTRFLKHVAVLFGVCMVGAAAVLLLWPA